MDTFFLFLLLKLMLLTQGSLKLAFQQLLHFSSREGLGVASPLNSLSWISLCKLDISFLEMAVKFCSLRVYTRYGQKCKLMCVYTRHGALKS